MTSQVNKKVLTYTLQFLIFIILLVLFIVFYMKDQLLDFTKHRTTITTRNENPKELEFPTIILCMKPGSKNSVAQKLQLENLAEFFDASHQPNFNEKLENLSFLMNRDLEILINQIPLDFGLNQILDISPRRERQLKLNYQVESIVTYHHATCIKIEPRFLVQADGFQIDLQVRLKDSLIDQPQGFYLYLTSNR